MSRILNYPIVLGAALLLSLSSFTVVNAQSDAAADLPPNAKAGECYARVMIPAVYEASTENVIKKEASERIEVIPASFEWVEEQVLIKPASSSLKETPAKYEWTEEKILVKPAQTVWKKGNGPIEKLDNGTGEIMCLVEEPAVYETVRKLVSQPAERRVQVPAEYGTVTKRQQVSESRLVWKPVLCQTNMSTSVITELQRGLKRAGHDPGPIDGVIGKQTLQAVNSLQRSKNMASGGLTMETLRALDVRVN